MGKWPARLTEAWKKEIRPRLSADMLWPAELDLDKKKPTWRGACPVHGGDNDMSLSIFPRRLTWKCFSCGAKGGPIEWWTAWKRVDEQEAVRQLAQLVGYDLAVLEQPPAPLDEESLAAAWKSWRERRNLDRELLDLIDGRLVISRRRPAMAFATALGVDRVRYLDEGKRPKIEWREKDKGRPHWYGLQLALERLWRGGRLYVVNGEPSVWACIQSGVPAVCTCGEGLIPGGDDWLELVKIATDLEVSVGVVYDCDDAGGAGAWRLASALCEAGVRAVSLALPAAELPPKGDVDDLHRKVGDEGLAAALGALPERPVDPKLIDAWIRPQLEVKPNTGEPKDSIGNVILILEHDRQLPKIWNNSFDLRTYRTDASGTRPVADTDYSEWRLHMANRWGVSPHEDNLCRWVGLVASRRARNPLQEWLSSLRWDGEERISGWLRSAAGVGLVEEESGRAETVEICRVYARKFLVQAIARAMAPGCKADSMLVLVGAQGIRKSTLFQVLASPEYFVDSAVDPTNKDTFLLMYKAWIMEYSELSALRRSDNEAIKSFLTRPSDLFRPPYGRSTVEQHRHTVFVGTSNETAILRDPTGSRRFWPVAVRTTINLAWIEENRDQLWAEALVAWKAGEQWWLTPEEEELRVRSSREFEEEDVWTGFVEESLRGRTTATVDLVIAHLIEVHAGANYDRASSCRVTSIMRMLGWTENERKRIEGKTQRVWVPPLRLVTEVGSQGYPPAEVPRAMQQTAF